MVNDENNRWSDEDPRYLNDDTEGDVMEKMFSNKRRRNVIDKEPDTKNQDIEMITSRSSQNEDIEMITSRSIGQNQKSDTKEDLKLSKDLKPDNMIKTVNGKMSLDNKEKTQTPVVSKIQDEQPISKSDIKDIKHLLENIVTIMRETYGYKKYPYDEKSRQAMEEGTAIVYKYRNYYDVSDTIKKSGPIDPQDFDSPVYNAERIFEILERYSDIIYVINDGVEPLFVVISHEGRTNFSKESVILPGEVKQYYNTYELRLRSPTVGHPYRVTEYMIVDVSETSLIPFELASLQDLDLPSAGENWLEEDIVPIHPPTTIRIQVAVSKTGIFSAAITRDGNIQVVDFNVTSGPELVEDGVYVFELLVNKGDSVNFRYSTTGGIIKILRVQEVDAATA